MYRIQQIKLKPGQDKADIPQKIQHKIKAKISDWNIVKESIDARDKNNICLVYTVDFNCDMKLLLPKAPEERYQYPPPAGEPPGQRPVIVGFGPCGIYAALILADLRYKPIVLERGKEMESRVKDVETYWKTGKLNEESNVQFGEGGAGTFSDGKLTTGIRDSRIQKVLEEFVVAGGKEEIFYKQKPHIGTDVLRGIVVNLRKRIIERGGEIRFQSKVTDLIIKSGKLQAVEINDGEILPAEHLILSPGHSARDTFRMLKEREVPMEQKPFSMGVRIQHSQQMINQAQYGEAKLAKLLGPAEYKLNHHCKNSRGVYTFCMCPGGEIILAATQKETCVTNGMSDSRRDGEFANSGLLVDIQTSDFMSKDILAGVDFQEKYERLAYQNGNPPKVCWEDFSKANPVRASLPVFVSEAISEAMPNLGKKLKGFDDPQARLTAVESRSSSPIRILRNNQMESKIEGIYPAGEGAGYAGGIVSAATDGIKAAEQLVKSLESKK